MPTLRGSVGIRILGLRCSWWHLRQANDAVASERSIFSKNQDYKRFFCVVVNPYVPIFRGLDAHGIFSKNQDYKRFFRVAVNPYVPIFRGLDAHGGRKLQTDTHTHTGQLK